MSATQAVLDRFVREELEARNRSPHTRAAYRRDLVQFCNYLTGSWNGEVPCTVDDGGLPDIDWNALGSAELRGFLAYLHEARMSQRTLHRKLAAIRTFFKFLKRNGLVDAVPAVDVRSRSIGRRQPRVLFYDEVERLLRDEGPDSPILLRDLAIIETLYGTGMRVGTLVRIDTGDLSFDPPQVRVLAKGAKEQVLPLGTEAVNALQRYLTVRNALLDAPRRASDRPAPEALFLNRYGGRLTDKGVRQLVHRMTLGQGLGRVTPHTFRHTVATHLLEQGADVRAIQELLGHASLRTTGVYTQLTVDAVRQAYTSAHPRSRKR